MSLLALSLLQVYKERVLTVAVNCAQQAAKCGVKRFIHVSTAQVYNSDKVAMLKRVDLYLKCCLCIQGVSHEVSKLDPWTLIAKYHLKAEQELKKIDKYVCL